MLQTDKNVHLLRDRLTECSKISAYFLGQFVILSHVIVHARHHDVRRGFIGQQLLIEAPERCLLPSQERLVGSSSALWVNATDTEM